MTPFCGGHIIDQDGHFISVSGQEEDLCPEGGSSTPLSLRVLLYDRLLHGGTPNDAWRDLAPLNSRRWYPTVSLHHTGKIIAWNGVGDMNTCDDWEANCPNPGDYVGMTRPEWLAGDGTGAWNQSEQNCYFVAAFSPAVAQPNYAARFILATTQYSNGGAECSPQTIPPTYQAVMNHDTFDVIYSPEPGSPCSSVPGPDFAANHADGPFVILPMKAPSDPGNGSWLWIGGWDGGYYDGCDNNLANNSVDRYDAATNSWIIDQPMTYSRMWANAVLLPDETIFVHGGAHLCWPVECATCPQGYDKFGVECAQLAAELYTPTNPPGSRWRKLAKAIRPRNYHSVALLIPDGRILVAGGEYQINRDPSCTPACPPERRPRTLEFYKPPYFFKTGNRPQIVNAAVPANAYYGGQLQFTVNESISASGKVMLIRPSSVTHGVNMSQQIVELQFTESMVAPGEYQISASIPFQASRLLPPGWEMLWVMDNQGLPAVQAKWVKVMP
jgi:hypothetical protein